MALALCTGVMAPDSLGDETICAADAAGTPVVPRGAVFVVDIVRGVPCYAAAGSGRPVSENSGRL
jgi:hypothetical protein